jgi:hypothetical protein
MDVRYIRRSRAWTHAINILTHVRIPAYTDQDESGRCQNVCKELRIASHRRYKKSGDRQALLENMSIEA